MIPPLPLPTPEAAALHKSLLKGDTQGISQHMANQPCPWINLSIDQSEEPFEVLKFAILYCPPKTLQYLQGRVNFSIDMYLRYALGPNWEGCKTNAAGLAVIRKDPDIFFLCEQETQPTVSYPRKKGKLGGYAQGSKAISILLTGLQPRKLTPDEIDFIAEIAHRYAVTNTDLSLFKLEELLRHALEPESALSELLLHPKIDQHYPAVRDGLTSSKEPAHNKRHTAWLTNLAQRYIKSQIQLTNKRGVR